MQDFLLLPFFSLSDVAVEIQPCLFGGVEAGHRVVQTIHKICEHAQKRYGCVYSEKLLEEYIQVEIKASNGSLEKLNILLHSYNSSYRKLIKPHILRQLIDIINRRNHNWLSEREDQRERILNFC